MKRVIITLATLCNVGTGVNAQSIWDGAYAGITAAGNGGEQTYCPCGGSPSYNLEGTTFGIFAGYNFNYGSYVLGGEIAYTAGSIYETQINGPSVYDNYDFESIIDVKARIGYDMGRYLPYATLGFTSANWSQNGAHSPSNGYVVGAGIDYAVSDQFFIGAEYVWRDVANSSLEFEASVSSISLRGAYKF